VEFGISLKTERNSKTRKMQMTRSKALTALLLTGAAMLVLNGCHTTVIEKQAPQQDQRDNHQDDHHDDHNQQPPPPPDRQDDHH